MSIRCQLHKNTLAQCALKYNTFLTCNEKVNEEDRGIVLGKSQCSSQQVVYVKAERPAAYDFRPRHRFPLMRWDLCTKSNTLLISAMPADRLGEKQNLMLVGKRR